MKCLNHGVTSRQGKAVCCSSVPSSLRSSAPVFPLLSPAALRDHTTKMSHQTGIQGKAPIHLFGNVRRCLDDAVCRKKKKCIPDNNTKNVMSSWAVVLKPVVLGFSPIRYQKNYNTSLFAHRCGWFFPGRVWDWGEQCVTSASALRPGRIWSSRSYCAQCVCQNTWSCDVCPRHDHPSRCLCTHHISWY